MKHLSFLTLALTLTSLAACGDDKDPIAGPAPSKTYSASVTGDLSKSLTGPAAFGADTVDGGEAVFAVTLGDPDSDDVLVLVRSGSARPGAGTYPLSGPLDGTPSEWSAIYIIGDGDELVGLFTAESGTLTITESSAQRLKATFQMEAVGYMAGDFETEVSITVSGSFDAGAASSASLRLNDVRLF